MIKRMPGQSGIGSRGNASTATARKGDLPPTAPELHAHLVFGL